MGLIRAINDVSDILAKRTLKFLQWWGPFSGSVSCKM